MKPEKQADDRPGGSRRDVPDDVGRPRQPGLGPERRRQLGPADPNDESLERYVELC